MLPPAHHALGHWSVPIVVTLLLAFFAICYFYGWLRLRSSADQISQQRLLGFLSGLVLLWVAVVSPLSSCVHRFLTAHMIQHLLLMTIAPALVLLGDPLKVFERALPAQFSQSLEGLFRVPPLPQLGTFLTNPKVCWLASTATLIGWHVPAIFSFCFKNPAMHQFEQFTFVSAGFLFWWPVIRPWPAAYSWPRWLLLIYLFLATLPCDILSAYLTFCDSVVYPSYLALPNSSALAVLRDQQLAGSLMWTCITLLYLIPAATLTTRLLERSESEP
jgi:cytochrome c oxidase assembly factor CtaG